MRLSDRNFIRFRWQESISSWSYQKEPGKDILKERENINDNGKLTTQLSRKETPNTVGGVTGERIIMVADDVKLTMLRHVDDDVEEKEDYDVEEEDVEVKDRSKDQEAHFVGDCAVEMQTDISQEPFFAEI